MSKASDVRDYRVSSGRLGRVGLLAGAGALGIIIKVASNQYWSGTVKAWILLSSLLIVGLFVFLAARIATRVDSQKITLRGLVHIRTFRWSDIQEIRAEVNPAAFHHAAPREIAFLYDQAGRRFGLPNLNEKNLDEHYTNLRREVEAIREIWTRQRGAEWSPRPEAQRQIAERQRHSVSPS